MSGALVALCSAAVGMVVGYWVGLRDCERNPAKAERALIAARAYVEYREKLAMAWERGK